MTHVRFVRDFYFRGTTFAVGDTTEVEDWTAAHLLRLGNVVEVIEEDSNVEASAKEGSDEEVAAAAVPEAAPAAVHPDPRAASESHADAARAFDRARNTGPAAGMNRSSHKLPPHRKV